MEKIFSLNAMQMYFENLKAKLLKKRKGNNIAEMAVVILIIALLISFLYPKYQDYIQAGKITKMNNDMKSIGTAAVTYEYWNVNGLPPDSISAIIEGVSAADSRDGQEHAELIKANNSDGSTIIDPWGQEYGYDSAAREISCTPKGVDGQDLQEVVVTF